MKQNFMDHMNDWGLSYGTQDEFEFRFQIYQENDKIINEMNANKDNTFEVGHNMFSTLTKDEYQKYKGRMPSLYNDTEEEMLDTSVMAGSVDWRSKGVVSPVQDQGNCGSCWAFSSTAAIESSHAIQTGKLLKLSEQHFVDCDKDNNEGCNGGLEVWAFQFAEKNKIALESDYPYKGRDRRCKVTEAMG
jgi:C1A family cysteine protease